MQPAAVAKPGFDGVAEGVAEVQKRPGAALALVSCHHLRLVSAGAVDDEGQRFAVEIQHRAQVRLYPGEKFEVADEAVLDNLGESGAELPEGKGPKGRRVRENAARLVERADHVLAQAVIHRGLAADRGVHLGEERRRHLNVVDTALIACRGESGHVSDHPSAQRYEGCIPGEAALEQGVENPVEDLEILERLPVREHQAVAVPLS